MRILIDVGNTRIKVGWIHAQTGEREQEPLALEHGQIDRLDDWLAQRSTSVKAALGATVAHDTISGAIDALIQRRFGLPVKWIGGSRQAADVLNAYDQPALLGADRWVSMLGLTPRAKSGPVMLANFGTATTVDTLAPRSASHNAEGETGDQDARFVFHGGLILPGPALMRSSLATGTANLPEASGPTARYPTHTLQAISSGIAAAQAGAVLRQWREGIVQFGAAPDVYVSGGAWPIVEEEVKRMLVLAQRDQGLPPRDIQYLRSPVLDGLARLAISESE